MEFEKGNRCANPNFFRLPDCPPHPKNTLPLPLSKKSGPYRLGNRVHHCWKNTCYRNLGRNVCFLQISVCQRNQGFLSRFQFFTEIWVAKFTSSRFQFATEIKVFFPEFQFVSGIWITIPQNSVSLPKLSWLLLTLVSSNYRYQTFFNIKFEKSGVLESPKGLVPTWVDRRLIVACHFTIQTFFSKLVPVRVP